MTPEKFVVDYRLAVTEFLDTADRMKELISQYTVMGWDSSSFEAALAGADITAEEFEAACDAVSDLIGDFTAQAATLTKLRA